MPNIPEIKIGNTTYKVKDADFRNNAILASSSQPSQEENRLWINEAASTEYQVPTYEEFGILKSTVDDISETQSNILFMLNTDVVTSGVNITTDVHDIITFVSGTSTAGGGRTKKVCEPFTLPAGTYTYGIYAQNEAASQLSSRIRAYIVNNADDVTIAQQSGTGSTTFTIDADTVVYASVGPTSTSTTYSNAVFAAMLNKGNSALPYESPKYTATDAVARKDINDIYKGYYWKDKKIVCFGDSRTWYDGQSYGSGTKSEWQGKTCIGYQEQLRNILGAIVINEGVSGNTSPEICTRIRNYDFSNADAVILAGGVNDFIEHVPVGSLQAAGSVFDTSTIYGAWQSAIEYIQANYPGVQIFVLLPAISWSSTGAIFPYDIASVKKYISTLYNLAFVDLYKTAGINEFNRNYYYADASAWTHFNDYGNALLGQIITGFVGAHADSTFIDDAVLKNASNVIQKSSNLLKLNAGTVSLASGSTNVTLEITAENEITFTGTGAGTVGRTKPLSDIFYLPPGTYTLSCEYDTPSSYAYRTRMRCYLVDANDTSTNVVAMTSGQAVTVTLEEEQAVFFSCTTSSNSSYDGYQFRVMLNEGGSAEDYESPSFVSAKDNYVRDILLPEVGNRILCRNYNISYANANKPLPLINV